MKDIWFADNRDLVKWSVLFHLAEKYGSEFILQIAYYRHSVFEPISIDGEEVRPLQEIIDFFRNIRNIERINGKAKIAVFDRIFDDRDTYLDAAAAFVRKHLGIPKIVFLDPDTGLEPRNPGPEHVLESEAKAIWNAMEPKDVFVFYQHQTNRNGQPWVEPKRQQLVGALGISDGEIKVAEGTKIARDVVFYYAQKG